MTIQTHKCPECEWTGDIDHMDELDDMPERVSAGEFCPAGQCPECGALIEYTEEDIRERHGWVPDELLGALNTIAHRIAQYRKRTEKAEHTDIGEAWDLFDALEAIAVNRGRTT